MDNDNIDRDKEFNNAVDRLNQASSLLNNISLKLTPIIDIVMKLQATVEYMQEGFRLNSEHIEDHCNILHRGKDGKKSVVGRVEQLESHIVLLDRAIDDVIEVHEKKYDYLLSKIEAREEKKESKLDKVVDRKLVIIGLVITGLIGSVALILQLIPLIVQFFKR